MPLAKLPKNTHTQTDAYLHRNLAASTITVELFPAKEKSNSFQTSWARRQKFAYLVLFMKFKKRLSFM